MLYNFSIFRALLSIKKGRIGVSETKKSK